METPEVVSGSTSIRIIVVADHVILRQGIRAMLHLENDFEVVGEAENGRIALRLVTELGPDIVLIDTSLEATNGLAIAQQLLPSSPNTRIVLFSGSNDQNLPLKPIPTLLQ